jgi:hypothetical protein
MQAGGEKGRRRKRQDARLLKASKVERAWNPSLVVTFAEQEALPEASCCHDA